LWGLINLLPVYPLDGGRVAREICTLGNPRRGIVLSLRISMVVAALMAAIAALSWNSLYTAILFGYLAYSSYRTLEAYQRSVW
jgi:Zn-dependent protease